MGQAISSGAWLQGNQVDEEIPFQLQIAGRTPLVLRQISRNLPLSSLSSFRLVCAQWEFICRDRFFALMKVSFPDPISIYRYTVETKFFSLYSPSNFSIDFQVNMKSAYETTGIGNFVREFPSHVRTLSLTAQWRRSEDVYKTFGLLNGLTSITDLHLKCHISPRLREWGNLLILLEEFLQGIEGWTLNLNPSEKPLGSFPTLRRFSMVWTYDPDPSGLVHAGQIYNLALLAPLIITLFPNLEEFTLDDGLHTLRVPESTFLPSFFQALHENPQNLPHLHSIALSCNDFTPEYILLAPRRRFSSLKLFFHSQWDEECAENMKTILENNSSSLESLQLIFYPVVTREFQLDEDEEEVEDAEYIDEIPLRFPIVMEELKSLKLLVKRRYSGRFEFPFEVNYSTRFPKLEELTLNIIGWQGEDHETFQDRFYQKFFPRQILFLNRGDLVRNVKIQFPTGDSVPQKRLRRELRARIRQSFPNCGNIENNFTKKDWRLVPSVEDGTIWKWDDGVAFWRY